MLLVLPLTVQSATLDGRVVKVTDGDKITILDSDKAQHKIRLAGIDAPESNQPWGQRSKQNLADLVAGREITVDWNKRDRYGRIVGKVIVAGRDACLAQLRAGMAWWYRKYAGEQSPADQTIYEATEARARASRVGLWTDPQPTAPWDWRK